MFKELPVIECEDDYMKAMNYLVLGLTAFKAAAKAPEVITRRGPRLGGAIG